MLYEVITNASRARGKQSTEQEPSRNPEAGAERPSLLAAGAAARGG